MNVLKWVRATLRRDGSAINELDINWTRDIFGIVRQDGV